MGRANTMATRWRCCRHRRNSHRKGRWKSRFVTTWAESRTSRSCGLRSNLDWRLRSGYMIGWRCMHLVGRVVRRLGGFPFNDMLNNRSDLRLCDCSFGRPAGWPSSFSTRGPFRKFNGRGRVGAGWCLTWHLTGRGGN